jgi:rhomboid protease GluP
MEAGRVTSGEWWRTVTALTLHVDLAHLGANLVFGALFGLLAGQALGGGVAWLLIVMAGALGNFANAWLQLPEHISIGASTAVFSALGLIVVHAVRPDAASREPVRRWSPVVGGVLLLAFLGVGRRANRHHGTCHRFPGRFAGRLDGMRFAKPLAG